ncbi:peptidoglycan-associated lipoprotein Pal [Paraglaciecola aquimarina]|uniref:Peptidoglycan-associated lipoprotein n=1 Tax=Paraglaciecola aquimarina TaxID=1235557 RepID=A0ABU3T1A7_9ALTE|nr:peptidoglycan-associated lipoprotein Pal [Paraglaciecola aquimarina]MDU0356064.1 peptidoglycan-associated lipoprotein Pal [Paraglaciecola aquimarina]
MQLNKIFKGLVIALPVVTMVACSSGPSEAELEAERNRVAQEQAEADRKAQEAKDAQIQAGSVNRMLTPVEEMRKELAALENNQVVYFDFDRASISSKFYSVLDQHAAFLTKHSDKSVVIEGHCDSRGTPEYNIALGESRAKSIQTYLLNAGVSASQISVVSYGEEKPINSYNTEAAFAENRRGVLVYQ